MDKDYEPAKYVRERRALEALISRLCITDHKPQFLSEAKTAVFAIPNTDLVAKVTDKFQDCLISERRNICLLAPLTERIARAPDNYEALHNVDGFEILLTQRLWPVGIPTNQALIESLDLLIEDISRSTFPFPTWQEKHNEVLSIFEKLSREVRLELAEIKKVHLDPIFNQSWELTPIHGDAYSDNAILTAQGVVWLDIEDVQLAPRSLGFSLVDEDAPGIDPAELLQMRILKAWEYATWDLFLAQNNGALVSKAQFSLRRLRELIHH